MIKKPKRLIAKRAPAIARAGMLVKKHNPVHKLLSPAEFREKQNNFHMYFGTEEAAVDMRNFIKKEHGVNLDRFRKTHPKVFARLNELVTEKRPLRAGGDRAKWERDVTPALYKAYKILRAETRLTNEDLGVKYW